MATSPSLRYTPPHSLPNIALGARCRICATVYGARHPHDNVVAFCGGEYCRKFPPTDPVLMDFSARCCAMQDIFLESRRNRLERYYGALPGMSYAEFWWWDRVQLAHCQCENNLVVHGTELEEMLQQGWCEKLGGPIREIREMKLLPSTYFYKRHCAFAVRLVGRGWWVFDPTGVQFGADWPLLSPYNEYRTYACVRPGVDPKDIIMCRPLGTSFDLRNGRRDPF